MTLAVLGSISNSPVDLAGGELDGSDGNGTVTVETNLLLTSSASEINYGDSVSFTATVSPVNLAYSGYGVRPAVRSNSTTKPPVSPWVL